MGKRWQAGKKKTAITAAAGTFALAVVLASLVGVSPASAADVVVVGRSPSEGKADGGPGVKGEPFSVNRFVLPDEAKVLVVVEGTEGSNCNVYAYEKTGQGWAKRLETAGILGKNGMSNHRTAGDLTTPIGVFQMNTPFGQSEAKEGFPPHYVQVTEEYVWTDDTNRLVEDSTQEGEHVGTAMYVGYYDYVLDSGYNRQGIYQKGSALFLHCQAPGATSSGGCVAIPKEQMEEVMRLYGTYGDGACYIAQAPKGTFHQIYHTYGVNNGLSPEGDFGV